MSAPLVQLDFAANRTRVTPLGVILLMLGLGAAAAAYLEYRSVEQRRAGLELKLAAALRQGRPQTSVDPRAVRLLEEADRVAQQLGTPWTGLLEELELASRDTQGQVAVLSIEPDQEKHSVHITGESRTLPIALAYLQRLQSAHSLRYPMLDSHDVRTDDAERPVRFAMTAEWREAP